MRLEADVKRLTRLVMVVCAVLLAQGLVWLVYALWLWFGP